MLRVFVYLGGGPDHVEVKVRPAGQTLAALKDGRKVNFWWTTEEVDADPGVAPVLRSLVPNVDRLWVGRDFGHGGQMQAVFDGVVVETGFDPAMVSVTGIEPPRSQPYPPTPPAGGVREPLRPAPAGPGPESNLPPAPPAPAPVQTPVPVPVPVQGHVVGTGGTSAMGELFVRARQGQAPVPLGAQAV